MNRNLHTFADYEVTQKIVNSNHMLVKVDKVIDWSRIEAILVKTDYRRAGQPGRDCYSPMVMFKILLIERFYNLSDREIEENVQFNVMFMWFCGLSFESSVPDHSTICRWRERFMKFDVYQQVFDDFYKQLEEHNINIKAGAIVDATIVSSQARPRKKTIIDVPPSGDNTPEQPSPEVNVELSKDPDAGNLKKCGRFYHGYGMHTATHGTGIITAVVTTPANVRDVVMFEEVVSKANLSEGADVEADKGYDSENNRKFLQSKKLNDKKCEESWHTFLKPKRRSSKHATRSWLKLAM